MARAAAQQAVGQQRAEFIPGQPSPATAGGYGDGEAVGVGIVGDHEFSLHFVPLLHGDDFNAPAHLVFSASARDVSDVWVQGRHLVSGGEVISVDVAQVAERAQSAAEELFARRRALQGDTPSPASTLGKNA